MKIYKYEIHFLIIKTYYLIMRRIFNFCTKLKPTKNEELIKQNQYVYAKDKLKLINDPKFIEKILRIEESK